MKSYFSLFVDRRLLFIFVLGFASGFPWALIGSTFSAWLSDSGLTRTSIGILGSVTMIYALNFLWAPLLDRVRLPWVCARMGQRRGWILLAQIGILLGTLAIATTDPGLGTGATVLAAALIVFSSATQDVGVDAYRIEMIPAEESRKLAAGSAVTAAGWWTGAGLPGAVAFMIAGQADSGWTAAYFFLAGVMAVLLLVTLLLPEPVSDREAHQAEDEAKVRETLAATGSTGALAAAGAWLTVTAVHPLAEFVRRNGWRLAVLILSFIVLFKVGEAFMGRMATVFYLELGLTHNQIAMVSGFMGWFTMVGFILLSGLINVRLGIFRGLLISGVAMALANLMFSLMAVVGPHMGVFAVAVIVDNFTTAFSTVAFVAFISFLTSKVYTASQYALMASLGNLSRTSLAAGSGYMVDVLGGNWAVFFAITAVMAIPGLLLLISIRHKLTHRLGDVFRRATPTVAKDPG
ncbi:AmpG family muropeptide MFS transporter [Marinimicrobium alkaliphilum]|uniref:AmpG family muropeptide MFS transporter n=1 Tax=Marinimicrobium alkaliphilum TaxID=2202654 RepID=UPI000DBA6D80|nr:MFS transporter [Marinimicrobium alkaliphilum]